MKWFSRKCYCKNKNQQIKLTDLKTGTTVTVVDLCKNRNFRNQIISLGIQPGVKIEILKKAYSEQGCMIIRVGESRLIINSKLAEKIKISNDK
jgi:Fe2+ transport system protein FeoA